LTVKGESLTASSAGVVEAEFVGAVCAESIVPAASVNAAISRAVGDFIVFLEYVEGSSRTWRGERSIVSVEGEAVRRTSGLASSRQCGRCDGVEEGKFTRAVLEKSSRQDLEAKTSAREPRGKAVCVRLTPFGTAWGGVIKLYSRQKMQSIDGFDITFLKLILPTP